MLAQPLPVHWRASVRVSTGRIECIGHSHQNGHSRSACSIQRGKLSRDARSNVRGTLATVAPQHRGCFAGGLDLGGLLRQRRGPQRSGQPFQGVHFARGSNAVALL